METTRVASPDSKHYIKVFQRVVIEEKSRFDAKRRDVFSP